jgi:hypothetical protein
LARLPPCFLKRRKGTINFHISKLFSKKLLFFLTFFWMLLKLFVSFDPLFLKATQRYNFISFLQTFLHLFLFFFHLFFRIVKNEPKSTFWVSIRNDLLQPFFQSIDSNKINECSIQKIRSH